MARIAFDALRTLVEKSLVQAGCRADAAADTALALVTANAEGLASHGVSRLPLYLAHLRNGRVVAGAVPRVTRKEGAVRVIDAQDGMAYPACRLAVTEAAEAARTFGIGLAAVVRSNHFGAAAHHLRPLAAQGLVGLAFSNSPAAIAPWGGRTPIFGTNPVAAIFPRKDGAAPLVIDLSLSEVARGKLLVAAQNGQDIPLTWAKDAEGNPTSDPAKGLTGSMAPAGGAKGAMLALTVELLVSALAGSAFGFEADSFYAETGNRAGLGHLFLVINPAFLGDTGVYQQRLEDLLLAMLADQGVRLPGQRRADQHARSLTDGIDIPDGLLAQIESFAQSAPH